MFQLLDDDHPEVLEGMTWFLEVFVDLYRVRLLGIVPMFVDASVRLLGLYFPDILSSIVTVVAPCQIDTVLTPASGLLSYVEAFSSRSVGEHPRVHDVGAAPGIPPSMTRGASA